MSNPNEQNNYTREVRRDVYEDDLGNTHTNITQQTKSTVNTRRPNPDEVVYHDGYVDGQVEEHRRLERNQALRDNDNAVSGLLMGIIVTSFLGLVGATAYFITKRPDPTPVPVAPVVIPNSSTSTSPSPSVSPAVTPQSNSTQTTTIERTTDRVVPVPSPVLVPVPQQVPQQNSTTPNTSGTTNNTNTTVTTPSTTTPNTGTQPYTNQAYPNQPLSSPQGNTSGTTTNNPPVR